MIVPVPSTAVIVQLQLTQPSRFLHIRRFDAVRRRKALRCKGFGRAPQLTRNLTEEQIRTAGFDTYFVDRTAGVYPTAASGFPWSAASMAVKGDLIADLTEDLAAEQKARVTYDNILRLSDDPDVNDVIKFLRAREIVHFQRFGEGLRLAKDKMDEKNVYFVNPSFDK